MTDYSRRKALQLGLAAGSATIIGAPAFAATYNFVRIAGLAEQAVGEQLLMEVYKRVGIEVAITPMPGKRALQQASSGAKDGETLRVYALGENVKSLIRVPTALSSLQTVAFAKKDSGISVASKADLNKFRSVIVSGVLHTHAITEGVSNVNEVSDPGAMFKAVNAGRADLALTSYLDGLASIRKLGVEGITNLEPALNDQPLFHYVHETHRELVEKVDPIIKGMADSGELSEMRKSMEDAYIASL